MNAVSTCAIEGFPEGANVPFLPENLQEFAPGSVDSELKKLAQGIIKSGKAA
jgi:hypothetical protein